MPRTQSSTAIAELPLPRLAVRPPEPHRAVDSRAGQQPASAEALAWPRGHDLALLRTPFGARRFEWEGTRLVQRSMGEPSRRWEVPQVADSIDPAHPRFNVIASRAKTIQRDCDYMRDRLKLPVYPIRERGGLGYTEDVGAFPLVSFSRGALVAICAAWRALEAYRGTSFEAEIEPTMTPIRKVATTTMKPVRKAVRVPQMMP